MIEKLAAKRIGVQQQKLVNRRLLRINVRLQPFSYDHLLQNTYLPSRSLIVLMMNIPIF